MIEKRDCCICDICTHVWVKTSDDLPPQCTSRKCRSRKWNSGQPQAVAKPVVSEVVKRLKAEAQAPVKPQPEMSKPAPEGRCPEHGDGCGFPKAGGWYCSRLGRTI